MWDRDLTVTYAILTDQGDRPVNEDFAGAVRVAGKHYFVLCDGLGGHGNGDAASRHITACMLEGFRQGLSLEDNILRANHSLLDRQLREQQQNSMKTTLVCLELERRSARFSHVGDSRVYWFERNKCRGRSHDHSVPQLLADRGEIRDSEIRHHPDRSRLLRVMGVPWDSPQYQAAQEIKLSGRTSFLLCSDGFWELIEEKGMEKLLKGAATPEVWLTLMQQEVLRNGKNSNMDNYTAIAVFVR